MNQRESNQRRNVSLTEPEWTGLRNRVTALVVGTGQLLAERRDPARRISTKQLVVINKKARELDDYAVQFDPEFRH